VDGSCGARPRWGEQLDLGLTRGVVAEPPSHRLAVVATGAEVRAGEFLEAAGGVVLVEAVRESHGGRECRVRPPRGGPARLLWFWPLQAVRIVARTRAVAVTSHESAGAAAGCVLAFREGRARLAGRAAPRGDVAHAGELARVESAKGGG
jgi:hypothetical protein